MSKYFDVEKQTFMAPEVVEHGRHMVLTNVHKEKKVKYVNIDTRFQEEYQTEKYAKIQCKLPQAISNVKSMKVVSGEVPATFYNFSIQKQNTYFKVEDTSTQTMYLVKLHDGNYSSVDLDDELNIALGSHSTLSYTNSPINLSTGLRVPITDISFTFDTETNKMTMTTTNPNYIVHFNVDENGAEDKRSLKSKIGWTLGFREPTYTFTSQLLSFTSETFVNENPFRYLYLSVDEFSASKTNSFLTPSFQSYMDPNVVARISLDPNVYKFGSIISVNNNGGKLFSDVRVYHGKTDIQRLHIQLLDEEGKPVDLNRMDFSFLLEIEYD